MKAHTKGFILNSKHGKDGDMPSAKSRRRARRVPPPLDLNPPIVRSQTIATPHNRLLMGLYGALYGQIVGIRA